MEGESRREIFVVVCRDGKPHPGRQDLTLDEAQRRLVGLGVPMTAIDDWDHPCGPHRIQRFIPEGEAFDPRQKPS